MTLVAPREQSALRSSRNAAAHPTVSTSFVPGLGDRLHFVAIAIARRASSAQDLIKDALRQDKDECMRRFV
jgi:hypothetical protein